MILRRGAMTQRLAAADLTLGGVEAFRALMGHHRARVVYSDPPWSPGNEKWWRRHAGVEPPGAYDALLDAWCLCAHASGAGDVFVEQSVKQEHCQLLLAAVARCHRWTLPLLETWTVEYGSPKRPNALLHFGTRKISTDPTGMSGEAMTRRVFEGLTIDPGSLVCDPCTGLGTSSRVAHAFGCDFVGTELNPKRLNRTVAWLYRAGYMDDGRAT